MSPVEMKKVFEDLREEVQAMMAGKASDSSRSKTLSETLSGAEGSEVEGVSEFWVEMKYNPVLRHLGYHLDCHIDPFEIAEGQYSPRLEPEQNPITGELGLAPRFVSCSLMLKKLDAVLALIDSRFPKPEQKPVLQRAS